MVPLASAIERMLSRSRRRDFSLERMEPCEWMDKDLMPWRRRSYGRSDGDCILRQRKIPVHHFSLLTPTIPNSPD
uniref:Uncharacterized protein n=1 Tax=Oryza glumipatula TaxID=40148 RepID=A0A0D9Y2Y4_9ORYZ